MQANRRRQGLVYEELALAFLEEKGYRLLKRNFIFGKEGELDLVMLDGGTYVFVEVKGRTNYAFGPPEDSINEAKRRVLKNAARGYMHVNRITSYTARFDVVAVDYVTGRDGRPEIRHWIDAFR